MAGKHAASTAKYRMKKEQLGLATPCFLTGECIEIESEKKQGNLM